MPKVETLLTLWGPTNNETNSNDYVSKNTGNDLELESDIVYIDNISRPKRDLDAVVEVPPVKKRRRVVKKLVRVQLKSSNETEDGLSTEASEVEASTRRARRRLKVKKRKRLLKQTNSEDLSNSLGTESEERLQQATKPRRKVVITKKRLLSKPEKSVDTNLETVVIESSSTTTVVLETTTTATMPGNEDDLTNEKEKDATQENIIEDASDEDDYEDITTEHTTDSNEEGEEDDIIIENPKSEFNSNDNNLNEYESEESRLEEYEDVTEENLIEADEDEENTDSPTFQSIPDYEPFFPELTESLDAPVLLLKTTVLSSVDFLTKTIVQSRLRTYTFVVTRVHGTEQIVTSSTEVKPQTQTSIVTESLTKYTTLTLLDFDATQTLTEPETTTIPTLDNSPPQLLNQGESAFV